ncbi:Rpn family recombination-promoting nuclease/putative transposase, partial [Ectothiorhodospira shaposhnikovii]|uniref:Rpn family recombination-promoting nuclease/putative transposase n=1 Tax=Ectothiorhodospira shaposhnikovii TaxID=1054 RepID=UPI0019078AF5
MPRPRCEQISLTDTPYYHIISRCVRRTFLCGQDHATGRTFEHRRQWIEDRIRLLASLFAVDVAAYAVMSNHYHMVIKLDPTQAESWSDNEVLRRWSCPRHVAGRYRLPYPLPQNTAKTMGNTLPNPHDTLFKALLEDPERAGALLRESLPKALTDKMAGDPQPVDGSFI